MGLLEQWLWGQFLAAILMLALWLVARKRRDAGIVDVGWSAALGVLAVWLAAVGSGDGHRRALVGLMTALWSLRLATYLLLDRVIGKEEDGRYRSLRLRWGARAERNFFWFFQAQGVLAAFFALPVLIVSQNTRPGLDAWDAAAVGLWLIAVGGESLADAQLASFRRRPENRGRTCRQGLWRTSRHPNYFFEWLHWWTYVLLASPWAGGTPWGWVTLIWPGLMLLFLFRLTGIPHTEAQALRSRGDDYREYQRTTSVFVPWFSRPS